jgi:hypothetical protein
MFCTILSWFGEMGPFLTNVCWSYLAYYAAEHHAYSTLAGVGAYVVLNELHSIKRRFVIDPMGWI